MLTSHSNYKQTIKPTSHMELIRTYPCFPKHKQNKLLREIFMCTSTQYMEFSKKSLSFN